MAAILAAIVPGLGLMYAGETRSGGIVLAAEVILFGLGWGFVLVPLHAWQIVMAAGTASVRAERGSDVFETRRAVNAAEAP